VKTFATYGIPRSGAYVRVVLETIATGPAARVLWREGGARRKESFPATAEGKRQSRAFAQGTFERLSSRRVEVPARLTLHELFGRYVLASEPSWRPKTRVNEINRWRYFAGIVGDQTFADLVTPDTLDEVRKALITRGGARSQGIAPNQVHAILSNVTRVWRLARARKWLAENTLADYRIPRAKEDRAMSVDEFRPEEAAKLMARLEAKDSRRWRAHVACRIAGTQGPRANALLHARDADFDLVARTVRWRAEHDKLGRDRVQPLTRDAAAAVRIARIWKRRIGYTGSYLLPPVKATRREHDRPLGYGGLVRLLHVACAEAGVEIKAFRGMHAFRRMAARTVLELTGDINAAAEWIGDTDLRVVKRSYLKERPESLVRTAALIRMPTEASAASTPIRPSTITARP
jgi:hypothetical protein